MKKIILFILGIVAAVSGMAQGVDSTGIVLQITLSKDAHKHAIRCLGVNNMSAPERINYLNDLVDGGFKTKADTAKITVSVPSRLVVDVYRNASRKPEGVVVNDNQTVQNALLPQVYAYKWLLNAILAIKAQNAQENKDEKDRVEEYILQINP